MVALLRRTAAVVPALLAVVLAAVVVTVFDVGRPASAAVPRPIVFVHGAAGSAAQFQTQAKRFASNGYAAAVIDGIDYDFSFGAESSSAVLARLDRKITALLQQTGADKVDLVAHSLGTFLSHSYLDTPSRAARVAHYVNLDGATALRQPGGVPTLAIWGEGSVLRRIGGAENVYQRDQSHTQTVTSAQSFSRMYRFFTGSAPQTTAVVAQTGPVQVSGQAVLFPSNVGAAGMGLTVYEVSATTGRRTGGPVASFTIGADGSFGPFTASPSARYEFALAQGSGQVQHHYLAPLQRTDRLVRLLTNRPGEGIGARVPVGPAHSALSITRYKEWWGDQGSSGDTLSVNGTNIVNAVTAPRDKRAIGVFAHDQNSDRRTDLTTSIPDFDETFITAADIYVPAAAGGSGTVTVSVRSRASGGVHEFVVPNWPSDTDRISLTVPDL
ncbi:alpha/beta fold hydrolase [Virgisporangium ochraceum]|uniref:Lipase n=1 Tax=Virgisporangium ochraceum TaxID=65505 RepID=A0A8J4A053_9ACTN|nr:alpha/beta fold hydrolase [Virgisporangium ochraceum]GIJ72112.1 lipase [Virgisporangium ochraceum]